MECLETFERFIRDVKCLDAFDKYEEEIVPAAISKVFSRTTHNNNKFGYQPRRRFNPLIDLNEYKFRIKYRFSKENLRRIIEIVRDDLEVEQCYQISNKDQVPVDLQIMAAIRMWGGTEHPEITASIHGVSMRTLAKICRRVATALASKASRYIRMPATLSEKELVMRSFQELANMPQVIGVVGHTSVRFRIESHQQQPAREDYIHLQVVCDALHKIRDLDLRSTDEMCITPDIFSQSRIKERFEQNEFRGRLLLCSNNLPCSQFLFSPIEYPNSEQEQLYNHVHSATYAPANKCINLWLRRFGILRTEMSSCFGSSKHTVTALALLHNMAMEWNDTSIGLDGNDLICDAFLNKPAPFGSTWSSHNGDDRARSDFIKTNF